MPENPKPAQEVDGVELKVTPETDHVGPAIPAYAAGIFAGKYEIISKLGDGGMGSVYKAKDILLNRFVALKMLAENRVFDDASLRRFQQEARAIGRLDDPRLVRVFELSASSEIPYIAMELIEGRTLAEILKEQTTIPIERCIALFKEICEGLQHAHDHKVIHRDLKPSNVIICSGTDEKESVKIVDFGIAKLTAEDGNLSGQAMTKTGEIFGSPLYMSPEQCLGRRVDERSDQYSLGCMLYECLTGSPPHVGNTSIETLIKHQTASAYTLREGSLGLNFPASLEEIAKRLLAKDPADRYGSMAELKLAFDKVWKKDAAVGKESTSISAIQSNKSGSVVSSKSKKLALIVGMALLVPVLFFVLQPPSPPAPKPAHPTVPFESPDPILPEDTTDDQFGYYLRDQPNLLEVKKFHDQGLTNRGLAYLRNVHRVTHLDLSDCTQITAEGLKNLAELPLTHIKLSRTNIDDIGILVISKLPRLEEVQLEHTKISDEGLRQLARSPMMSNLKGLSLSNNTKISDAGLVDVPRLKKLQAIDLTGDSITNIGLDQLQSMKLRVISLGGTSITDGCGRTFRSMPSLNRLDLRETQISDSSLLELARIKALNSVNVFGCPGVTDKGIQQFMQLRKTLNYPHCDVLLETHHNLLNTNIVPNASN